MAASRNVVSPVIGDQTRKPLRVSDTDGGQNLQGHLNRPTFLFHRGFTGDAKYHPLREMRSPSSSTETSAPRRPVSTRHSPAGAGSATRMPSTRIWGKPYGVANTPSSLLTDL